MPLCTHGAFMTIFRAELPKFVFQLFQTKDYERQVNADLGATINSINGNKFIKYEFYIPVIEQEQKKIADCLSSIDSIISTQSQRIELLKEHKKGLLQNLFPKDGENIPKFRFPEFINNEVWEDKFLKEVLIKNSLKNKDGKYLLVQSVSNKHGFINQDEYFENRRVASKDTSNYYVIKKGFFAYNPSRIDVGSLAYKFDDEPSIISPLYVSFRANKEKIVDIFLLNWFFSENFTSQMIFEGGVRNTLNYENLIQIKIKLPKNIEEQQKIADCLTSIDEGINLQSQRLDALKEHKKALLQQLFLSSEANI
jgi:type I restriction enzyme S subunit